MKSYLFGDIEHVCDEQELSHGRMRKTNYHAHYLAYEGMQRADEVEQMRHANDPRTIDRLAKAFCSAMGEYSKLQNYRGKKDFNRTYVVYVREADSRVPKERNNLLTASLMLKQYVELNYQERIKALTLLINAGVYLMREYESMVK